MSYESEFIFHPSGRAADIIERLEALAEGDPEREVLLSELSLLGPDAGIFEERDNLE